MLNIKELKIGSELKQTQNGGIYKIVELDRNWLNFEDPFYQSVQLQVPELGCNTWIHNKFLTDNFELVSHPKNMQVIFTVTEDQFKSVFSISHFENQTVTIYDEDDDRLMLFKNISYINLEVKEVE